MKIKPNYLFDRFVHSRISKIGASFGIVIAVALLAVVTARAVTILSIAGYGDYTYGTEVSAEPTDGRPESKLWWNDGSWWGNLFNPTAHEYQIYRLDWNTQDWVSTNTTTDLRLDSRADVLWDGVNSKLYVLSHVKLENPTQVSNPENWARLYRYSYDTVANSYLLDAGFNSGVNVNEDKTRTVVLDKDSTGRLWVTYVSKAIGATDYNVYVNFTTTSNVDEDWDVPYALPFPQATVNLSAISSVIAFTDGEGPKVGVAWTNEIDNKFYFATHLDSAPPGSGWVIQTEFTDALLPYPSNNHINIAKSPNGQLFFAIKTEVVAAGQPLIALVARDTDGTYSFHAVSPFESNDTRPIAVYYDGDAQGDRVYIFSVSDPTGGVICSLSAQITSPLSDLTFDQRACGDPGLAGAERILGDETTYTNINNVTSTKQVLNETSDIVILASDVIENTYVHALVNTRLPYVLQVLPADGSSVPNFDMLIRATFNMEMDPATLNNTTFTLTDNLNTPIPGTVIYYPSNHSAIFTPDVLLTDGRTYTVTLTSGVKSADGQPLLNNPYIWEFTVTDTEKLFLPFVVNNH
jgi:Bacterial Ig-like domain